MVLRKSCQGRDPRPRIGEFGAQEAQDPQLGPQRFRILRIITCEAWKNAHPTPANHSLARGGTPTSAILQTARRTCRNSGGKRTPCLARSRARLAEVVNDAGLEAHNAYPERFLALVEMPIRDAGLALKELNRVAGKPGVRAVHFPMRDYIRRFHYDSMAYWSEALRFLVGLVGSDRIVIGTDGPGTFTFMDVEPNALVEQLNLPATDRDRILRGNAARLLRL